MNPVVALGSHISAKHGCANRFNDLARDFFSGACSQVLFCNLPFSIRNTAFDEVSYEIPDAAYDTYCITQYVKYIYNCKASIIHQQSSERTAVMQILTGAFAIFEHTFLLNYLNTVTCYII